MNTSTINFTFKVAQAKLDDMIFEEIISEMLNNLVCEAVEHFTAFKRPSSIADDPRYLYTKNEMEQFFKGYIGAGGNISELRVNNVYNDCNEFLCYEICRSKLFKRVYKTQKDVYYGEELADVSMFLPVQG